MEGKSYKSFTFQTLKNRCVSHLTFTMTLESFYLASQFKWNEAAFYQANVSCWQQSKQKTSYKYYPWRLFIVLLWLSHFQLENSNFSDSFKSTRKRSHLFIVFKSIYHFNSGIFNFSKRDRFNGGKCMCLLLFRQ